MSGACAHLTLEIWVLIYGGETLLFNALPRVQPETMGELQFRNIQTTRSTSEEIWQFLVCVGKVFLLGMEVSGVEGLH